MSSPTTDVDLWSDETLADPYPVYEALRALGPVVWMELEIKALMRALVARVSRIEPVEEHRRINSSIRGLDRLIVRVVE